MAKGQPSFDADSYHVAAGKTKSIKSGQDRYCPDLWYDRGDNPEPDYDFDETQPERYPGPTLDNTDGSQGTETHIYYAGQKDRYAGEKYRYAEIWFHRQTAAQFCVFYSYDDL